MPTYQYACTACDHRFEAVQSFSDAALTECPECEGRLRKLFSSVGIVFKGSGFYRTDSRTGSGGAEKKSGESSSTDSSAAGKTEAKPAAKAGDSAGSATTSGRSTASSGTSSSTGSSAA